MDRKRCIWTHREKCTGGLKNHLVHHLISTKLHFALPKCMSVQNYIVNLDLHVHCQPQKYTLHQKKVTFSSSIFPGDPRLGSVTLGHFQNWWWQNHQDHQEIKCNFLSVKSVDVPGVLENNVISGGYSSSRRQKSFALKSYKPLYALRTLFSNTPGTSMMWHLKCRTFNGL